MPGPVGAPRRAASGRAVLNFCHWSWQGGNAAAVIELKLEVSPSRTIDMRAVAQDFCWRAPNLLRTEPGHTAVPRFAQS